MFLVNDSFRELVETSSFGVLLVEAGRIVHCNSAAIGLLGGDSCQEIVGSSLLDRVPESRRESVQKALGQPSPDCPAVERVQTLFRLDGTPSDFVVVSVRPLRIGGRIIQILFRDLTEHRLAQRLGEQWLRRYQAVLNASLDGIHIVDAQGRLLEANPAFCRILGYSPEEVYQLTVFDWDLHITKQSLVRRLARSFEAGDIFETQFRQKGGRVIDVEVSVTSVVLGGQSYLCGAARDVTERKHEEEERQREQRTLSLGTLASGISHDFNNILMGLGGTVEMAQVALSQSDLPVAQARLAQTRQGFERAKNLTHQLLAFAKGGIPNRQPTNLGGLLPGWVDLALVGSGLATQLAVAPDLWDCLCDPNQIGQVVHNVLLNARQASPEGGTILVRAHNTLNGGPQVVIEVGDEGPGIGPEVIRRVFDPYFTTKRDGTGLGLAVSIAIVRQHGGRIAIANRASGGAVFTVYLPKSPRQASEQGVATREEVVKPLGGRAIVLDDDPCVRDVESQMLRSLGFTVAEAEKGEKVVELYLASLDEGLPVALFLMDKQIAGGMGGIATMQKLRDLGSKGQIVLTSGSFLDLDEFLERSVEGVDYLAKPFSRDDLEGILRRSASATATSSTGR